ncbi:MAG: cell division protein FtsQ/DivIB [Geminicoccaceae bacterium]
MSLAARRAQQYLRRPPHPPWLRLAVCVGAALLGLGTAFGLSSWTLHGGPRAVLESVGDQLLAWSGQAGLAVRDVYVEGRRRTPQQVLRARLGIEIGMPILAVDPGATRQRLEQLGWIEQASVARMLPDAVQIRLLERQPLALWQQGGRFEVIDRRGIVIEDALSHHPEQYAHLRVLVGDDAPQSAAALFALLSTEPVLSNRVIAATRVGERRWNLHLDNQVDVWLPEHDVLGAWRLLAQKARDEALLERAITLIDLRLLPDRLRLRLDPAALEDSGA